MASGLVVSTPLNRQLVSSELVILERRRHGLFWPRATVLDQVKAFEWSKGLAVRRPPVVVPSAAAKTFGTGKRCAPDGTQAYPGPRFGHSPAPCPPRQFGRQAARLVVEPHTYWTQYLSYDCRSRRV